MIEIFVDNSWQPARDYQTTAFNQFKVAGMTPLPLAIDDRRFTIAAEKIGDATVIYLIREDKSKSPMRDTDTTLWSCVKGKGSYPQTAFNDLSVAYGSAIIKIRKGSRYFADADGHVIIGWHGSYNPPCGMDGNPL